MNFLFVGTNPENTGAAMHFVALAQAMAEAGHDVGVLTCPRGPIAQGLARTNVRVRPATFRNAFDPRYAAVFAAVRASEPDWLVGNFGQEYWPLLLIGRLLGIPVALFRHRTPPMKRLSSYFVPKLAQRFFAMSNYARQAYLDRGIPASRVQAMYNPVDLAAGQPDAWQRHRTLDLLGLDEQAIVLGYFGHMHRDKGIFTLLDAANAAMAREPRLHCLWVGDGPDDAKLRADAASHPAAERRHFISWVHDTHPFYSALSMLAFPSIAPETFGRVSIEAQAHGVPVLASDRGGAPETLDPGISGVLLPPGDVAAWEEAIVAMCNPSIRLPMGMAARELVEQHFSSLVIAAAFLQSLTQG